MQLFLFKIITITFYTSHIQLLSFSTTHKKSVLEKYLFESQLVEWNQ